MHRYPLCGYHRDAQRARSSCEAGRISHRVHLPEARVRRANSVVFSPYDAASATETAQSGG